MPVEIEHLLQDKETHQEAWSDTSSDVERDIPYPKPQRRSRGSLAYQTLLHLLLIASIMNIATTHFQTRPLGRPAPKSYTPAANVAEYYESHETPEDHGHESVYMGTSRESIDAWDDLVDPTFIAINDEELALLNASPDTAVRLSEHDGQYVAGLGVYHHLHCLRQLRWWVYQDTFYANLTEKQIAKNTAHLGHCVEALRVTLMCSADLTLYTFKWDDPESVRPNPKIYNPRQCAKWEPIDQWARERSVGYYPWLVRPSGDEESVHMR